MENRIIKKIVAYCLATVCCIGVSLTAVSCTKENPITPIQSEKENQDVVGEMSVSNMSSNGIKLTAHRIAYADYPDYGVSPAASMAQTLTATIGPAYATNKNVTWTAEWKDGNSTWAKGKTVTDYVTVVPTETGSNVATVSNLQAFGEQIIVKVTSESDPEVYATATIDYAKRIMEGYINFGGTNEVPIGIEGWGVNLALDEDFTITEDISKREFSDGTVDDTFNLAVILAVNTNVLSSASADTGYTYTAGGRIDFTKQTASFTDLIYYEGKPVEGDALEALNDYLYRTPKIQLFNAEIMYTGTYSNNFKIIPFGIQTEALFVNVTDVSLDKSTLVF